MDMFVLYGVKLNCLKDNKSATMSSLVQWIYSKIDQKLWWYQGIDLKQNMPLNQKMISYCHVLTVFYFYLYMHWLD
jgi:hypothetical protein